MNKPPLPELRVRYIGPFSMPSGFGQAGHDYLAALHAAGVELDIWPLTSADTANLPERYQFLLDYVQRPGFEPTHIVVHSIPRYSDMVLQEARPAPGAAAVLLTTWETTRLDLEAVETLNAYFDMVLVPSRFNEVAFTRSGVDRVQVVPHTWKPKHWPRTERRPARPFVFYTVGVWGERKNLLGLLKAYLTTFTAGDDVVLRICTPVVPEREMQRLAENIGLATVPRVEFVGHQQRLSSDDLLRLHHTSHCYVSATRGEAWGLGAFEAALVGNRVIMPGFGGQEDFLHNYSGWRPIGYQLTPAIADVNQAEGPLDFGGFVVYPSSEGTSLGLAGDQHWAEPDLQAMQFAMRDAVAEWQNAPNRVTPLLDRDPFEEFTYTAVAPRFIQALHKATVHHQTVMQSDEYLERIR